MKDKPSDLLVCTWISKRCVTLYIHVFVFVSSGLWEESPDWGGESSKGEHLTNLQQQLMMETEWSEQLSRLLSESKSSLEMKDERWVDYMPWLDDCQGNAMLKPIGNGLAPAPLTLLHAYGSNPTWCYEWNSWWNESAALTYERRACARATFLRLRVNDRLPRLPQVLLQLY